MIVIHRAPPFLLWFLIRTFIASPPPGTVFTYGRTIYSPHGASIPDDLVEHERTHRIQQGRAPWLWWARYLVDRRFRLRQETSAYRAQLRWLRANGQPTMLATVLMAKHLSGQMYGRICSGSEAQRALKAAD